MGDDDLEGDHTFIHDVDEKLIDSKLSDYYVYATHNGQTSALNGGRPYRFGMFKPKNGAALTAFTNSKMKSSGCSCHRFEYEERFNSLVMDGTGGQWTSINNYLYNKLMAGHSTSNDRAPRNLCKNKDGPIDCDAIKSWFDLEFGN